jgi:hypothetical protein
MNSTDILLATFEPLPQWLNFLAMALSVVLVAFATLLWLVLFRKKGRRQRKRHRHHSREPRKLNPTLAESGGLPPIREEKNSDAPTSMP